MQVRLTRLNNAGNNLRTDSVEGTLIRPVKEGHPIQIEAVALALPAPVLRYVTTSPVVKIEGEDVWTENTHYRLERLSNAKSKGPD